MSSPSLVIDSVTGVEVALPVAGPGARSFAFLIDWHIRLILAIAWYVLAALLYHRSWTLAPPLSPDVPWFGYVLVPPAVIYFLYHPVLETAMGGRTPGKRMAGVEIVASDGGAPGIGPLLTRNAFRMLDSLPLFYPVGLVATMLTRNHVRIGDLAAGTLLVYARSEANLPAYPAQPPGSTLDAVSTEIVAELLQRWPTLDTEARHRIARTLLPTPEGAAVDDDSMLRARLERLVSGSTP
jgi:uncharacterized RDD family membrane protein YckC